MAVTIYGNYIGKKHVELKHEPSGSIIVTEAPKDNGGTGSKFSPTDLVAAGLGSCILTILSLVAEKDGFDLSHMTATVNKTMSTAPRRIGKLETVIHLPSNLANEQRTRVEKAAMTCPVHHSLHPEIEAPIQFIYDL